MSTGKQVEGDEARLPELITEDDPDAHIGAVEGDRPDDRQHQNANLPALDRQGLPADPVKICEDVLGANTDESQG